MKERPILFSTEMVRAILEGRKTQTRRLIKPQPYVEETIPTNYLNSGDWSLLIQFKKKEYYAWASFIKENCPYGQIGDKLWCKETHLLPTVITDRLLCEGADTWAKCYYVASETPQQIEQLKEMGWKVKPSIFMPRWASRITLEITNIRVQRLQEISEVDCLAEGCLNFDFTPQLTYRMLWDSFNAKSGHSWDKNEWVWVISFKVVKEKMI